ncbi:MAG: type IV pilin, partial [ANME-2 cluster archaeon]
MSPVIGVILMVAIAVILAAVFGSSLFGMGSSIKKQ